MTWISFFTTSYQRQADGHTDRQTQWKVSAVLCHETKHRLFWVKHFSPTEIFPLLCSKRQELTSVSQQHPVMFEGLPPLTFSLRLLALMTFAAKVRPEEFSTHLCTWPKRPLVMREGGRKKPGLVQLAHRLHPGAMLENAEPGDLCCNDKSKSNLCFNWDVLLCCVCSVQ